MTIGIGSTKARAKAFGKYMRGEISGDELANVNLDPKAFRPDQSVVLSGTPVPYDGDPEGGSIAKMGVAEGPVEPCELVPALPSGYGAFGFSEGGGSGYTPRGDEALSQAAIAADLHQAANSAAASDAPGRSATRPRAVPLREDEGGPTSGLAAEGPWRRARRRTPGISCRSAIRAPAMPWCRR